jgi:hypothetical protein
MNKDWKNIEIKGLEDGDLNKYTIQQLSGMEIGQWTKDNKLGIHTDDKELRSFWASLGGDANIEQLLQWQKDNNHNIGEIAKNKTEEWKQNIGKGNTGKIRTEDNKEAIRNSVNKFNESMSNDERSKMYSNDARKNAATKRKIEILDSIEDNQFTSLVLRESCNRFHYDYKLMIKDTNLLELLYRGTNQNNPSIYKKIYK